RIFRNSGKHALESGWTTRAERLLDDESAAPSVEQGYVALLRMYRHLDMGDMSSATEAAQVATVAARRQRDPDLLAMALSSQGRLAIYSGRIAAGVALLDEALAGAAGHGLTPVVFGDVYCTAIE